ncbi:MAG TPA: ATP-binding protein [Actinomycetota bacterium]|nr:ATP-binding protein [Actinomycetota bacterium]
MTLELDLYDSATTGFRLHRLEIFNWGTFNERVWSLDLDGDNTLVTGDIGSGKSTLVDAITTLLVPPNKISYNKAAGAEHRERTASSYVLGHFKAERTESSGVARPVALRGTGNYSVLLARFANLATQETVTLAQVFWFKDRADQPSRIYAVSGEALSIAEDFRDVGRDLANLRRHLRGRGSNLYDSFSKYSADFRRRMGITHPQALDLFHQTVSMKSVGNLTEFVRTHMLEPADVDPRIESLIKHFQDLNRAHDLVVDARRQVDALTPLVTRLDEHDAVSAQADQTRAVREALSPYFALRRTELLTERIARRRSEREGLLNRKAAAEQKIRTTQREEHELLAAIRENGGERQEQLQSDIADLRASRDAKRHAHDHYVGLCEQVGVAPATDEQSLVLQQHELADLSAGLTGQRDQLENSATEQSVTLRDARTRLDEIETELKGLADRSSSIDQTMILLRARLCEGTGLDASDVPFAGELLRVSDEQWEPAAERLLRGFALSLLVRDEDYAAVAKWVDQTDLRGRLVYYRVRSGVRLPAVTDPRSLVHKLEVRPGTVFSQWLEAEVHKRFDLVCAGSPDEFRNERRALTRNGQIKGGGERHEKDDRRRLGDRRWYVLGWDNAAKRRTLEKQRSEAMALVDRHTQEHEGIRAQQRSADVRAQQIAVLMQPRTFSSLDWQNDAARLQTARDQLAVLRESNDTLKELNQRLSQVQSELAELDSARGTLLQDDGKLLGQISSDEQDLEELARLPLATADQCRLVRPYEPENLQVRTCESAERTIRAELQATIDRFDDKVRRLSTSIVAAMGEFRNQWPLQTQDMDTAVQAGGEYRALLQQLLADDLPRFEDAFKKALNTHAIREVVGFRTALEVAREDIKRRIGEINASLRDIPYQPHTYIRLEPTGTTDADVRDFRAQLRACTEDTVTGSADDHYSEKKFLQVKDIVSRLQGREGRTVEDKRWTAKVTDVRNWFTFAASERLREDDSEHEHYADSGGKSGGQKEKLAYTILAASLAYQFGLVSGRQTRSFRFVVIDEAFGRGSDESARFGLELFRRMDLQLLVVTPMQKIHIIEPYVAHVGFTHNEGGVASKLRNLTIEQHLELKRKHAWRGP